LEKYRFEILGITSSQSNVVSYTLILEDEEKKRRLPIVIGMVETQSIMMVMEGVTPNRPLTHDLMKNFMLAFNVDLHEVIISDLQEGIFYSKLLCSSEADTVEIDSRTSDALAMAVRFGCPIFIYENIFDMASSDNPEIQKEASKQDSSAAYASSDKNKDLKKLALEELHELLNEVLEQEDYIRAIAIRDEINTRK
jgi:bifunctional DNase/RNase